MACTGKAEAIPGLAGSVLCPAYSPTDTTTAVQAVAGPAAVDHMQRLDGIVRSVASQLKAKPDDIPARVAGAATQWPMHKPTPHACLHGTTLCCGLWHTLSTKKPSALVACVMTLFIRTLSSMSCSSAGASRLQLLLLHGRKT